MPSVVNSWRVEYRRDRFGPDEWVTMDWRNSPDRADKDLARILVVFPDADWLIVQRVVETTFRFWKGKDR